MGDRDRGWAHLVCVPAVFLKRRGYQMGGGLFSQAWGWLFERALIRIVFVYT